MRARESSTSTNVIGTIILIVFICAVLVYFAYSLYLVKAKNKILGATQYLPVTELEPVHLKQGFPVRLKIPKINVDAAIEYVGVTDEGVMAVPSSTTNTGWFDLGPIPGEKGSAVIAGHLNSEEGEAAVFTNLYLLHKGEMIYVEDNQGTSIAFVIREIREYDPGYAEDVFSRNDGVYLNLITCGGVWNDIKKTYSKRLVVFAEIKE
jgi:LPXTG-site transpeptidase (sortase) family protein